MRLEGQQLGNDDIVAGLDGHVERLAVRVASPLLQQQVDGS